MQKGTIKTLKNGFGFITPEGGQNDVFFHMSELQGVAFDDLREGDTLQFEVTEGQKGPQATNVTRV